MKVIIIFLGVLFPLAAIPQSGLSREVEAMKKDPALKHAAWSLTVIKAKNDSSVFEYNSSQSLVPASTMKILTTGAALALLGPDFKFETKLEYDGLIDTVTGTLKGNLYIVGGGDPSLGSEYFTGKKDSITVVEKWALLLKQKGIRKIEGAVIGDASIFEDNMTPPQWIWSDMGNYFGAGACGLTYHDNKYSALFNSAAAGSKTKITSIVPAIPGMELQNNVTAGGSDDNAFIYGSQYSMYRSAQGTIPANKVNYEVEGSIPDPALFCAQSLKLALEGIDVRTTEPAATVRSMKEKNEYSVAKRSLLHTEYSPTLDKIVYWTNLKSLNLFAEHLLKYLAWKKIGIGTTTAGTEAVAGYWRSKGIDTGGLFMNDGSGLSRSNVLTTKTQAEILRAISQDKTFDAFYKSLPVAGRSGSLGGLCEGTCAENNLRAKSGYITRARGYAGYVKNSKGELLCFSLLANNYECSPTEMKKKLERILVAIACE